MGSCRFLYDNFLTPSTGMTSSSTKTGLSTGALKVGTGSATLENRGSFTGEGDLEYIGEIDSVVGGPDLLLSGRAGATK